MSVSEKPFAGRCALITGATAGIGQATAQRLLEGGAKVVAIGRRADRLEALAGAHPGRCAALALDVTDAAAVAALPATLPAGFAPDILINNAGLALGVALADAASVEDWDRVIDTNIRGLVHITRAFLPALKAAPRGDIVNLGSVAGAYPYPGGNVYGATKAFVAQFSLNLRADLLGANVRVTNIEPGMTETEFSTVRFGGDTAKAEQVYAGMTPLSAQDIAHAIAWVLSLPPHVNVNRLELMPTQQAFAGFAVSRD